MFVGTCGYSPGRYIRWGLDCQCLHCWAFKGCNFVGPRYVSAVACVTRPVWVSVNDRLGAGAVQV